MTELGPPQLFGELVAISDNAEPRMHILFLNRSDGGEVCSIPVFDEGASTTENGLPGLVRVDLVPDGTGGHRCQQVWRSPEKSCQVLPKLFLANGLLYVYTYERLEDGAYTWYLNAVDFATGQTAFRIPTGTGLDYANFGPPLALGPDGTAYLGTMGGLLRIADGTP